MVMPDLPRVHVEMHILPHTDRTRARLTTIAAQVQSHISSVTGSHTAVRIATLAPERYVVLK